MPDEAKGGVTPPDPQSTGGVTPTGTTPSGDDGKGVTPPADDATRTQGREGERPGEEDDLARATRALDSERTARRDAERQLRELQDAGRSDLEKAIARADRAESERDDANRKVERMEWEALARQVAGEAGIPTLWDRLRGDDLRALRADATRLRQEVGLEDGALDGGVRGTGTRDRQPTMDEIIRFKGGRR
jgi:hypothetical protein